MVKQNIPGNAVILIIGLIFIGTFIFQKPTITGKVIEKEAIFSENLNLQANESGTYEWKVKNPGSIRSLKVTGSVTSNGTAKIYVEKNGSKFLLFDSGKQLFDIDIHVLPEYKMVGQGEKILIQNILFNLRGFGAGNVKVEYSLRDPKGNVIATQEEIVFIETQAKFIRELIMPAEIKPGTYIAYVEATSNGTIVGTGSDTFEVKAEHKQPYSLQLKHYLIGIAGMIGVIIIIVLIISMFKEENRKKELTELKEKAPLEKIERFEKELMALEEAYKVRLISEASYKKEKARIEQKLGVSKKEEEKF